MTSRHLSFLASHIPYQRARVAILGVPLERTVSFRGGTSQGPSAIRYASSSIESFSAIFRCDLSDIGVCDLGDLDSEAHLGDILEELSRETERILRDGKGLVVLGGEHTVTLGAIQGATAALGRVQVLVFDAHSDLRDSYRGEKICHATVSRRVAEVAERVVIVGARSFFGPDFGEDHFATLGTFAERLSREDPIWLSLDLDVLDPGICPGVTNPEPGGFSYRDLIEAFRELRGFRVVGLDIVELAPPFDPSGISAVTAAKLVQEAICAFWG